MLQISFIESLKNQEPDKIAQDVNDSESDSEDTVPI